jgi:alpha-galactosidase
MKDTVYPFYVTVCYRAYQDVDMIETWTEIENQEKKPVRLTRFDSGTLPIRYGNVWITHLTGSANNETRLVQEPLDPGMMVIRNKDGVRNSHTDHAEVMFSLDGKPQEHTGQVIGAALCYSGNYEIRIHTRGRNYHEFLAGICPDNSAYILEPKEIFETPVLALTYSDEGHGGASRNFHRWARRYKLANGMETRKILLNSWEGVGVHINEEVMDQMMGDIAYMGGELFVMDDGWFGDKYPRNND